MFDFLFSQYKLEMYDKSIWKRINGLQLYEKVLLFIIIAGSIIATIFAIFNKPKGALISAIVMILGILIDLIIQNKRNEKIRISNGILEPRSRQRIEKMSRLLEKCEIDINDMEELDALIKYAKVEKNKYDVWRDMRGAFKGLNKYLIIPIITVFITELFKGDDGDKILHNAISLMFFVAIIVIGVVAFAPTMNDIFNAEVRKIDELIRDVEELKVFKNRVNTITADMKDIKLNIKTDDE